MLCATSDAEVDDEWEGILSPAASDLSVAKVDRDVSLATNATPSIRRYILNKEANGLPAPFQLYTYLVGNLAGRATGVVKMWSRSTGSSALFVEFAWPPLGWVLVFDGSIKDELLEVTNWSQHKYDEEVPVTLNLPCYWLQSKMPLDFRTPAQMDESRARNQAILDAREKRDCT